MLHQYVFSYQIGGWGGPASLQAGPHPAEAAPADVNQRERFKNKSLDSWFPRCIIANMENYLVHEAFALVRAAGSLPASRTGGRVQWLALSSPAQGKSPHRFASPNPLLFRCSWLATADFDPLFSPQASDEVGGATSCVSSVFCKIGGLSAPPFQKLARTAEFQRRGDAPTRQKRRLRRDRHRRAECEGRRRNPVMRHTQLVLCVKDENLRAFRQFWS